MSFIDIRKLLSRRGAKNRQPVAIPQQDWRGVNYVDDIYTMPAYQLPYAKNVDMGNPIGAITKCAGHEALFASLGAGGIKGLHTWKHSAGDKLIAAWNNFLYLLSGASGSIAKTSQADWEAGTAMHLDLTTTPGVMQMPNGTTFTETDTVTVDFDGTHSDTVASSDHVELSPDPTGVDGITTLGTVTDGSSGGHDYECGYKFTVGAKDIVCTKLRIYPHANGNKTVRLWRVSDQSLLGSAVVAGVAEQWAEAALANPITLTAGAAYVVSCSISAGTTFNISTVTAHSSFIEINDYRYVIDGAGTFPTETTDNLSGIPDVVFTDAYYLTSGVYTHGEQDIGAAREIDSAIITFNKTTPANTTLTVEARVSTDGTNWGAWAEVATGASLIAAGVDVSAYKVQWRANLASSDGVNTPTLNSVTVTVTANLETIGTWLSPVYDMLNTPLSATLAWTDTHPATTTVTWYAAGSPDGVVFGDWQQLLASGNALPPLRYVKIKVVLTCTTATTPTVSDLLISYSTAFTQARLLDVEPLGRTNNELTGNRISFQDYEDRCYCADGLRPFVLYVDDDTITTGTAQDGGGNSICLAAGASAVNDFYNNAFITITGGTGAGQTGFISDYNGANKWLTISNNWVTMPAADSTYSIGSAVKVREAGVDAPTTAPTLADSGTAGSPNGAYLGKYTFVNADGYESNPSAASASCSVASKKITWTVPVDASTGNTTASRKLYRTKAGAAVYYYIATIADNTATAYTDDTADAGLTMLMLDNLNIPPITCSLVYEFLTYMFYVNGDELWFSKAGSPEAVPNITGDIQMNMCPSTILDIKSNPMALIPSGDNFLAPITTSSGFIFDSDPAVDTTTMKEIDRNGSLSAWASAICIDPNLRSVLVFPTNTGVRVLLPGLQEESIESIPLSKNIQPYFDLTVNRTNMAGVFFNQYYYLSMEYDDPATAANEYITFVYDFRTGEWYGPWEYGMSCYDILGNKLYGGSHSEGIIYQMNTGSSFAGSNIEMIADLPMVAPAGENHTYKFNKFMLMLSSDSVTASTTVKPKIDEREATVSLGALTDSFTGDSRPGHNNIRTRKYRIPLARGSTLSYRITDNSTNPVSIQKIITECTPLPLRK